MKFSPDQEDAISAIRAWYDAEETQTLTFGGLAGTGKTTIIGQLGEIFGIDIIYCAPTGKAARVLTSKLPGSLSAKTIHQLIYRPFERHCKTCPAYLNKMNACHAHGRSTCGCKVEFGARVDKGEKAQLFVVDEASMVSLDLYNDLISYTDGQPILFVGDHGQLPPIEGKLNLMADPDVKLEVIHRQVADSPILKLAHMARTTGEIPVGEYGPGVAKVSQANADFDFDPNDDVLMLCYKNTTRVETNKLIRNLLGYTNPMPQPGERLICLKNNWQSGIHNGMLGRLVTCRQKSFDTYEAVIDIGEEKPWEGVISARQFDYANTYQDMKADLWDFGYCLTVHKAQGSQARKVIIQEENIFDEDMWRRWLYTGITRAQEELLIIE